jgi:hypothetical protein
MIFDLAALGQAALGLALDATPLYATAGATYAFGPIGVHLWHGRVGNIILATLVRLGGPGLGAIGGFVGAKASNANQNDTQPMVIGIGVGCVVAAIVDDALISHEMLQFWERTGGLSLSPQLALPLAPNAPNAGPRPTGFTLTGTF